MPRPLRIEYKGAWYHIINKSVGQRLIFRNDDQRHYFLSLLSDIYDIYDIRVHVYCLLPKQFHLLIQTPRSNLSEAMRQLNGAYTQYFNNSSKTSGRLFRDRFKAVLIDADQYLNRVSRFIHLLPVTTKRVKKPDDYEWSSYHSYINKNSSPYWLQRNIILDSFGKRLKTAQYRAFVENKRDEELKVFYGCKTQRSILGNQDFINSTKQRLSGKRVTTQKSNKVEARPQPSLRKIMQTVANHFEVSTKDLCTEVRGRGGGNQPRAVAMLIARNPGGYPLKNIAKALKTNDISTISAASKRVREQLKKDQTLTQSVNSIKKELFGKL